MDAGDLTKDFHAPHCQSRPAAWWLQTCSSIHGLTKTCFTLHSIYEARLDTLHHNTFCISALPELLWTTILLVPWQCSISLAHLLCAPCMHWQQVRVVALLMAALPPNRRCLQQHMDWAVGGRVAVARQDVDTFYKHDWPSCSKISLIIRERRQTCAVWTTPNQALAGSLVQELA